MIAIGLTGLAGAGKSEVATRLIEKHGFKRGKFAGALKEMLKALLLYRGCDPETAHRMVEGDLKEVPTPYLKWQTPRHAMRTLGTEWGRGCIDNDLWVDGELEYQKSKLSDNAKIVFDDVRFNNEVNAIRRFGGSTWRINRPGLVAGNHISEQLDFVEDIFINNDGSLLELQEQVDCFHENFFGRSK